MEGEQVRVVRRSDFFQGDWPQGFVPWDSQQPKLWCNRLEQESFLVAREHAEQDPSLKQLIPYCILNRGGEGPWREVFCVRRRQRGSEERLRGRHSIGLGGHVGAEDEPGTGVLERGLHRELAEELGISLTEQRLAVLGLLNDDSNPVGSVHAGVVYRLDLAPGHDPVRIRERTKLEGGFRRVVELRELWQDPGTFETWSQILLDALIFPQHREDRAATH